MKLKTLFFAFILTSTFTTVLHINAAVPNITSFSPASGLVGTSVIISGANFNATLGNNIVFFGTTKAIVTNATTTSLTVTVPKGATYQPISVTDITTGLTAYSDKLFLPTFAGTIGFDASSMAANVDYSTPEQPTSIATGDLDDDGKPDIAVVCNHSLGSPGAVAIYRNTSTSGTVSFAASVNYSTPTQPRCISIGDLDGDGKLDLAIICDFSLGYDGKVALFRNTSTSGAISFAASVNYNTSTQPTSISIGDLDGDGKPDLAITNSWGLGSPGILTIFRNTSTIGTISYATREQYDTGEQPTSVSIGDLDGDGKPDIALICDYALDSPGMLSLYPNISTSGSISLNSSLTYYTSKQPKNLSIGDLDGDGKLDIAMVCVYSAENYGMVDLFYNTSTSGTISYASKSSYGTAEKPTSISIGDLDGDGKPDLAVTCNYSLGNPGLLHLFRNTSTNGAISYHTSASMQYDTPTQPRSLSICDLDGDGKPDIGMVCDYSAGSAGKVSLLRNLIITRATKFTATALANNSMTIGWTRGAGTSVMVVARAVSAVNANPVNGTAYTANAAYGSGSQVGSDNFVVYSGTGTSVNLTGLTQGTDYYFAIYECLASNIYKNPALFGNATTTSICTPPTTQSTSFVSSSVTNNSMTLGWVRGNGSSVMVIAKASSAVDATPVDGTSYTGSATFGSGSQLGSENYVVYSGTGTSVNLSALTQGTAYYYAIYEYFATNCYKDPALTGNVSTTSICTPPTTQATGFTSSALANTSMTVGWTRGTGTSVMVIAKASSAVDATPVDGTSYTGDAAFGSGSQLGSGNYVVYRGAGTSVNLSALTQGTAYYYAIYEYSATNCYKDPALTGNVSTTSVCTPPTTQATGFVSSSVTNNSMTLGWVRGNGSSVMVIAKSGSAVDATPVDGTSYTGNAAFGSGSQLGSGNYVVYNGTGTSVNLSALTQGTAYYYAIYEYSATNCYKDPALTGNVSTASVCTPPTTQATGFASSSVTNNSMTFGWVRGNGSSVMVVAKSGSAVDATPVDGTSYTGNAAFGSGSQLGSGNYVVYNGTGTTVNLTALTQGTAYYYAIYEYSATNCYKDPALTGNASTTSACTPPTTQTTGFASSSVTNNSMTLGWVRGNGSSVMVIAKSGSAVDATPVDGTSYTGNAAFGSGSQLGSGNYVVYNGTGTSVNLSALTQGTAYYYAIYEYSATNCYKDPALTGNVSTASLCTPPTTQATGFTSSALANTSMTVGWTRGNGSSVMVVAKSGSAVDATPVDGTSYTGNAAFGSGSQLGSGNYVVYNGTGTTVNLTALTQGTAYYYAIYEYSATNCYKDPALTGNASTTSACTPPTTQTTGFASSSVTNNSMTLGWVRGNGSSVMVIAKSGSAVDATPVDGTSYTGNAAFGSGSQLGSGNYVVYNGTGTTVNLTALTQGTAYYYAIYEYSVTNCYKDPALTGNVSTITTGISSITKHNIVIYPNPFLNEINIELEGNTEKVNYEILNSVGIIVANGIMYENTKIPTNSFPSGVYLIKLKKGKSIECRKIIKN